MKSKLLSLAMIFSIPMIWSLPAPRYSTHIPASKKDTVDPNKKICITLSVNNWVSELNALNYIAQQVRLTDMPSRQSSFINDSLIAPLHQTILSQLQAQMPKDSTKKK